MAGREPGRISPHGDELDAELSSRVGLSRSGVSGRFAELVGEPPLQYLARWRMTRAAAFARRSRCGEQNTPSFNKAFKRWQGASPGEYRRTATS